MQTLDRKDIGSLIKRMREDNNWTQDYLAEQLLVSRQAIVKTEKGLSTPRAELIERAYLTFKSEELVWKYMFVQKEKKELIYLASMMAGHNIRLSRVIIKHVIRESLSKGDLKTAAENVFQVILWDIESQQKANKRKIAFVISTFKNVEPDADEFANLLQKLYDISKQANSFDAFINISGAIAGTMKLDDRKKSRLLYQEATAYYFQGNHNKAYRISIKALEIMDRKIYPHSADVFQRHALICSQLDFLHEAIEHYTIAKNMATPDKATYSLALAGIARCYYMLDKFEEAKKHWKDLFQKLGKDELVRVHSLNDMIMMEIKLGNVNEAKRLIRECERLLAIALRKKWKRYNTEALLLERNKQMLTALERDKYITPEISLILDRLKSSYMRDEFELTRNFIHDKLFSPSTIESLG